LKLESGSSAQEVLGAPDAGTSSATIAVLEAPGELVGHNWDCEHHR
jgi:hypothetical protein